MKNIVRGGEINSQYETWSLKLVEVA